MQCWNVFVRNTEYNILIQAKGGLVIRTKLDVSLGCFLHDYFISDPFLLLCLPVHG
jgi:hypothetical protein